MLRIIIILITASLFGSASSFGQTKTGTTTKKKNYNTGFYGKRFTLQLGAGLHHNTILKMASYQERTLRTGAYYTSYRNQISSDQFNYSFYGNLGLVLKERTALSLDFNYYMGNVFLKNVGRKEIVDEWGTGYYTPGYDSRVKYTTLRIMPRIEIGSAGSNMPVGLVNVLGVGIELSKLKSGTYKSISEYESYNYYMDSSAVISDRRLTFRDEFAFNLTLLYGLEYRLPISKNIAWNFGGYLHLNLPIQELLSDDFFGISGSYGYNDNEEEYKRQVSRYRVQNLFSLRTGLVIML